MSDVTLTFSTWHAGCLRGLLTREIGMVERHRRVLGCQTDPADRMLLDAYLKQLRGCLATVETADCREARAA